MNYNVSEPSCSSFQHNAKLWTHLTMHTLWTNPFQAMYKKYAPVAGAGFFVIVVVYWQFF
jgi:hypothetical protein